MSKLQRYLVTGATSGIGRATALVLARRGQHLVVTGRDPARLEACVRELSELGAASVTSYRADLGSRADVVGLVSFLRGLPPLDGLVLAAGILEPVRRLSVDGLELNFAVNHVSKFLLLEALGETLAQAGARVVLGAPVGAVKSTLADIHAEKGWSMFQGIATSQAANDLLAIELARRFGPSGLRLVAWNPGSTRGTEVARSMPWWARGVFWLVNLGGRSLAEVGEQGADLVSADPGRALSWINGKRLVDAPLVDPELAARLWQMDEGLRPARSPQPKGLATP